MSESGNPGFRVSGMEPYVFVCENCRTRRVRTAVSYDQLGYPICPECAHEHGP